MPKVWCAAIECEHNKNNTCRAKEINLSDGHVHTVHQGYKHIWICNSFQESGFAKMVHAELEKIMREG